MSVTPDDVRHVARLARVGLDEQRIPSLVSELNGILAHMDVLQQVNVDGEWLRFATRSLETLGSDSPQKEVVHRYTARVAPGAIFFTLESGGGYSNHPPVEFVAHRVAAGS